MFKEAYRTGLTTSQFLEMTFWQYNAWCMAYKSKCKDQLIIQLQAAYYNAYWNSAEKHKKSLDSVLRQLQETVDRPKKPIDVEEVKKQFKKMEDLKLYGYTKCD